MAELTTGSMREDTISPPPAASATAAAVVVDPEGMQPAKSATAGGARTPPATTSSPSPKGKRASKTRSGSSGRSPFDERAMTSGGFFISGAWSKAGMCSCFNVRHRHLLGKHGVVFDMGVCPSEVRYHTAALVLREEELEIAGSREVGSWRIRSDWARDTRL